MALAKEARSRLLEGEPFEKVVVQYSEDPTSKINKGSLGFFKRGQMEKPFEEAAFSMEKINGFSQIIKTKFGFHILKLEARKKGGMKPFMLVKKDIIDSLKKSASNSARQNQFIELRSKASISMDKKALTILEIEQRKQWSAK
ncbi:MAG: hypothetical protein DRQ47_08985 [Gammaproteobacteria bacterium]|nr:MAG: hypothetical protein DRQ47_08985 [Gammaproteobacteria bacterium]